MREKTKEMKTSNIWENDKRIKCLKNEIMTKDKIGNKKN